MVWWPSRGAKRQETGVRIPLRSFFNWIEAPHGTETHLREKRLVCVPSPAFKIDYLTKYLSGPEPFAFSARDTRVRTSCCASQTCASTPPNLLLKENRPKKRASSLSRNIIGCYRFIPANTTCRSWIPMRVLHSKAPDTDYEEHPIEKKLQDHQGKSKRSFPCSPVNIKLWTEKYSQQSTSSQLMTIFSKGKSHQTHLNGFLAPCLLQF